MALHTVKNIPHLGAEYLLMEIQFSPILYKFWNILAKLDLSFKTIALYVHIEPCYGFTDQLKLPGTDEAISQSLKELNCIWDVSILCTGDFHFRNYCEGTEGGQRGYLHGFSVVHQVRSADYGRRKTVSKMKDKVNNLEYMRMKTEFKSFNSSFCVLQTSAVSSSLSKYALNTGKDFLSLLFFSCSWDSLLSSYHIGWGIYVFFSQ